MSLCFSAGVSGLGVGEFNRDRCHKFKWKRKKKPSQQHHRLLRFGIIVSHCMKVLHYQYYSGSYPLCNITVTKSGKIWFIFQAAACWCQNPLIQVFLFYPSLTNLDLVYTNKMRKTNHPKNKEINVLALMRKLSIVFDGFPATG